VRGSIVIQTVSEARGITVYPPVANFLDGIRTKNYEGLFAVDNVIAIIIRLSFLKPPCISGNMWYVRSYPARDYQS